MSDNKILDKNDVNYVAGLAKLAIPEDKVGKFAEELSSVLAYMSKIQQLSTQQIDETSQVTDSENILRYDEIDTGRMLTQEQALKNAKQVYNGYFVVYSILE